MKITPYQVDNVLNAYAKKNKKKISEIVSKENTSDDKYKDVVSLDSKEDSKAEGDEIISHNIRDIILKDEKS